VRPMKALSLWQPWASALALGVKRVETRSWPTRYRGPFMIHASLRRMIGELEEALAAQVAILGAGRLPRGVDQCPLGVVLALAELVDVVRVEDFQPTDNERMWGDYSAGRYAWIVRVGEPLEVPEPASGSLGFWPWPRPR
jgi:activating signal cointegrator 1